MSGSQNGLSHEELLAAVAELQARGETEPRLARDPVNQPMINNWTEAIGDHNPRWSSGEAPPAMAQVWTMFGLDPHRPANDPLHGTMQLLDQAGYTSVLGTNCDQRYLRPLLVDERVAITSRLESVVGPKQTSVGEGYFVTTHNTWWVGREEVATMSFRVLKFRPRHHEVAVSAPTPDPGQVIRPVRNRDNEFFFQGTAHHELRIQSCGDCDVLRHPPGPMCPECHSTNRGFQVAAGTGEVYSHLTHHAPALPGKELPLQLLLIELSEGVRMVGALAPESAEVAIGDPVRAVFVDVEEDLTLVMWSKA